MSLKLYDATITSYLQILTSIEGLLEKAEAFCRENNLDESELVNARLIDDMLPFAYQIKSCCTHSAGAIEGIRKGVFSPNLDPLSGSFKQLKSEVQQAKDLLMSLGSEEVEAYIGQDMCFQKGNFRLDFRAENFLLSFSQPNFYFHATTAYDILRSKGVSIGKVDYLGRMNVLKKDK